MLCLILSVRHSLMSLLFWQTQRSVLKEPQLSQTLLCKQLSIWTKKTCHNRLQNSIKKVFQTASLEEVRIYLAEESWQTLKTGHIHNPVEQTCKLLLNQYYPFTKCYTMKHFDYNLGGKSTPKMVFQAPSKPSYFQQTNES